MRSFWLAAIASIAAQTVNPTARELAQAPHPLTPAEVARVIDAARAAVAGKTYRLSYQPDGPGPDVLMGTNGWPQLVSAKSGYTSVSGWVSNGTTPQRTETRVDLVTLTHFTGQPARSCEGGRPAGELVVEYRNEGQGWRAVGRTKNDTEFAAPVFEMLSGKTPAQDGGRKAIGAREARAFVAPFKSPPGTMPGSAATANVTQALWIDVESLLPLQWEVNLPNLPPYGVSFTYDPSIALRVPEDVRPPDCIR